ncbi:MAG: 3-deoxy-manno-octulosonate cytidylyltransferase [Methanoregula sp.]|jgi:3-deoxy-manno-octulosonate cytidylyltransferase (CMP-KDO synthetase)|uniref:3-deoxy-manno-octulosonate cytidylyltransferase n=1 Tax=Methanoregula sp. TaxID=2052170 RepID=UPI003C279C0D
MKTIGIIPARMASTRFPGKPLAPICGIPMVGHILMRSRMSKALDDVYVATCDTSVVNYVATLGGKAVMTLDTHERATDRTAEAMLKIEKDTGTTVDIVVMIQGDEPLVTPALIDALVRPMQDDASIQITNLISTINNDEEFHSPNTVKIVMDEAGYALYFSREPIPSAKKYHGTIPRFKQLGIIAFRRSFLLKFNNLAPTPLEKIESVDMLRVLEHGLKIKLVMSPDNIYGVDTPEDRKHVEEIMEHDPIFAKYAGTK